MALSKSTKTKSYNQKTLAKMKARDDAKKSTTNTSSTSSKTTQLETIKQSLLKMQSDLQSGKVTGLEPSKATTPTVSTPSTPSKASTYAGPSVVDYLNSTGQKSDFNTRATLAANAGITGYTGTADQNTALLNKLRINTSTTVPSTALTSPTNPSDVQARRDELASIYDGLNNLKNSLGEMEAFTQTDTTDGIMDDPLKNPDQFLSRYYTTDQQRTTAEKSRDTLLSNISTETEKYYKDREDTISDAYDKYGVSGKQTALADIQKEMAEREVKLRNDVQVLETAPEYRGVSREFANDQRESIKSKGAFDLANLAIVESAYKGDLDTSRTLAKDLIDEQYNQYEAKIEQYKAQLAALEPQLSEDQKKRALAIEIALDERSRLIQEKKADTELRYEYAGAAAKAGAPLSVTKSILGSKSADEAFMLAAPYMKEESKTSSSSSSSVGGGSEMVPGLSSFTSMLANMNIEKAKMTDVRNGVREQFSPEFATKLISTLTDEQLRDFLIQYDAAMRQAGQSLPPEQVLQAYLEYIGKDSSGSSSGGDNIDSRIDNAF